MPKYGDASTVTGQSFRVKDVQTIATALPLPVVAEADLKSKAHPINIQHLSGKQKGAMVAVQKVEGSLYIAVARDALPESPWDATAMEVTAVTPVE